LSEDGCRIDVWLWRARFFKTRSLAAEVVESGRLRLLRDGRESRPDKPARPVKPGDVLTFAFSGRLTVVRIEALGDRRGPAPEARSLYAILDED
jgi:ribosome-associated heat shock protein Hsp15